MEPNEKYPLALPQGTILGGQYVIVQVLGQGGFGMTYKAMDHKTGKAVAVKEFFPDSMATRTTATTVTAFAGARGESFAYGMGCFLQEAETLAQFIGNENIVRVFSYFEENGTAYFVMEFVEGTSFDVYIKERGGKLPYEEAERILLPIMDALAAVHAKGIVHRDVTPDNIYITGDGTVKLLDFGAARYSLGDKSRSLDVVLKHGFAPKEQYTRHGKQGPYTDVYTLGASFYFAITGKRPPDSIDRMDEDELVPPSRFGKILPEKEDAILKALSVQPSARYQTMGEFRQALMSANAAETLQSVAAPPQAAVQEAPQPVQHRVFTEPQPVNVVTPAPTPPPPTNAVTPAPTPPPPANVVTPAPTSPPQPVKPEKPAKAVTPAPAPPPQPVKPEKTAKAVTPASKPQSQPVKPEKAASKPQPVKPEKPAKAITPAPKPQTQPAKAETPAPAPPPQPVKPEKTAKAVTPAPTPPPLPVKPETVSKAETAPTENAQPMTEASQKSFPMKMAVGAAVAAIVLIVSTSALVINISSSKHDEGNNRDKTQTLAKGDLATNTGKQPSTDNREDNRTGTAIKPEPNNNKDNTSEETTPATGNKEDNSTGTEPSAETQTEPTTVPTTESQTDPQPENKPETAPQTKPDNKPETAPQTKPDNKPETAPQTKPDNKPETAPQTKPDNKPEAAPEPEIRFPLTVTHENIKYKCQSDGTATLTDGKNAKNATSIPSTIKYNSRTFRVTSIGEDAFSGHSRLTSITIPEGVTGIGNSAFYGCSRLTSVKIPKGVKTIGKEAFYGCSSLTSVQLPEEVTSIGNSAFYECSSLTSIKIPKGVKTIGKEAFYGCSSLTKLQMARGVGKIDDNAFAKCTGLANVELPDSVTSIGKGAFSYCTSMTCITIPEGVTSIGDNAFLLCNNLTTVIYGGKEMTLNEFWRAF